MNSNNKNIAYLAPGRWIILSSIFLFSILYPLTSFSQKVGVVLSGGGAGGVTHIGVLKALEENNIPIDYIAGTSIGALIGGLYASGYSPDEIEAIFLSDKFYDWANGQTNQKFQFYYKEKMEDASWITFKFSLDTLFETNLPTSYINPFPVDFGALSVFAQANACSAGNFDSLFVPFRCVGANISNRQLEIFKKGDLATSIRASMSYPFFLSPVEIDGQLYFDGGIYNNFPADLMCRDFNPDFVIGSNSSSNFPKPQADNVLSQLKYMLSQNTNYEIECENGIVITTDVDVNVFDFSRNKEIIDTAYKQTLSLIDSIKKSLPRMADSTKLATRRMSYKKKYPKIMFDELKLSGLNKGQERYITRMLKLKKDTIGIDRLEAKLVSLTADSKIKSIYPKAVYKPESGTYKLNLDVEPEKKFFVSFGGNISNKPINEGFIGLQYHHMGSAALTLQGNGYFGQFYSSALGGGRLDLLFPFPFYIHTNFISNRWNYFESDDIIFEINDPVYLISRENFAEFGLGIPLGYKGKLEINGIGGRNKFEYYQDNNFTQFDTTDETTFNNTAIEVIYERNSLNRKQYPSKGSQFILSGRHTNGKEVSTPGSTASDKTVIDKKRFWYEAHLKYDKYYNRRGRLKFGTLLEGRVSGQPLFGNYVSSILIAPAFEPIPELRTIFQERYRTYSYVAAGLKAIYSISSRVDFRLEGFAYQPFQEIKQIEDKKPNFGSEWTDRYYVGSATTVLHTPVGPLALSLNYYNENVDKLSLIAHFGYILFNRKIRE